MAIYLLNLFGSASIGVYSLANERMAIVAPQASQTKTTRVRKWLGVDLIKTTVGGSVVIGALACANSNGIALPHYVREEELDNIKAVAGDLNLTVMDSKRTAFGNMVLSNDFGAIVDPRLKPRTLKELSDTLGVEVVPGEVAGLPYVGSLALATNKAVLAHPLIKEEEIQALKEVLKVPVDVGTINCGVPYVATGLIGNSTDVVAGFMTTGPELFMIGQALDVVE